MCDGNFIIGGPIWSGEMHNISFVKNLLNLTEGSKTNFKTSKWIKGILEGILVES